MLFNNDSTLQPSVEHRHLTLCILFGSFVSRRGIKSRHLFCVLIKMLYWRRRLIGERGLLERGAYWTKGLIGERGLSEKEAFFCRGTFLGKGVN